MSKVQQIEDELGKLSKTELWEIRDFLDQILEDELEFTPEFEAKIQQSERQKAATSDQQGRSALEVLDDLYGCLDPATADSLMAALNRARSAAPHTLSELKNPWAS
jgi:hypothetical protein